MRNRGARRPWEVAARTLRFDPKASSLGGEEELTTLLLSNVELLVRLRKGRETGVYSFSQIGWRFADTGVVESDFVDNFRQAATKS